MGRRLSAIHGCLACLLLLATPLAAQDEDEGPVEIVDQEIYLPLYTYTGARAVTPEVGPEIVDQEIRLPLYTYIGARAMTPDPGEEIVDQIIELPLYRYVGARVRTVDGVVITPAPRPPVDPLRPPVQRCVHGSAGVLEQPSETLELLSIDARGLRLLAKDEGGSVFFVLPPPPNADQTAVRALQVNYVPERSSFAAQSMLAELVILDGDESVGRVRNDVSRDWPDSLFVRGTGRYAAAAGAIHDPVAAASDLAVDYRNIAVLTVDAPQGAALGLRLVGRTPISLPAPGRGDVLLISRVCVTWDTPEYVALAGQARTF